MKRTMQHSRMPAALAAGTLIALWLGLIQPAIAGTDVWTGGSSTGNNWTDAANWGGTAPVTGDFLIFDNGSGLRTAPNNDFTAGTIFGGINFSNADNGSFTLGGNAIVLNNAADANNGGNANAGVTVGGGITNSAGSLQIVGLPITFSAGRHTLTTEGGAEIDLSGTFSRNTGAALLLNPGAGNINFTSSGLANTHGIIGGWALYGNDWAALDGSLNVVAYASYTDIATGAITGTTADTNLRYISDTGNLTAATGTTMNSLLTQCGAGRTLTITGTMKVGSRGGIYRNGASTGVMQVTGGTLTANGGGEITLSSGPVTAASGNNLRVDSIIANDGANAVVVNILGYCDIRGANTFTGGMYIDMGRVQSGNLNAFGPNGGNVYVFPSGHAFLNTSGIYNQNFFIAGVGSTENSGTAPANSTGPGAIRFNAATNAGTITLMGNARLGTGNSAARVTGRITGNGRLEVASFGGNNNMTFANAGTANDWTGGLLINSLGGSRQTILKLGANDQIPDGPGKGDVTLNADGTAFARLELAGHTETINGLVSGAGTSANLQVVNFDGPTPAVLTLGNNNATAVFNGVLQDANVVTNLSIVKIGSGTQTFAGAPNTHRGNTTINGGSLIFGLGFTFPNMAAITVNSNATLDVSAATYSGASQSLTTSNGTLVVALPVGAPALATTNLTALGATNFVTITAIPPISSYPAQLAVLKGTNVSGTLNFGLGAALPPSPGTAYAGYISNNVANNSVDLYLTGGPVQLGWVGYSSGALNPVWDIGTTPNWKTAAGSPTTYADGVFVRFDDSASNAVSTLNATVRPAAITVSNSTLNFVVNDDGGGRYITGSGGLLKQGSAKLTLDNGGVNDFSGGVTISAGTLEIGNNDTAGNLPVTGTIADNGALVFARTDFMTVGNVISGTGAVSQNSSGTLLLNGANTFTGAVTVVQGTLQIGDNSALGTTNGPTTIASGATLDVNGPAGNTRRLGSERIIVGGAGVGSAGAIVNSGSDAYPAMSFVTLTASTSFGGSGRWDLRATGSGLADPATAALSTSGQPYNLTKVGANEVAIANATIDPALADVDIQQGIFQINGNMTGLGNPANTLTVEAGATFSVYDLTNVLNKKIVLADTATFENTHGANTIMGPITLNGADTFNVGGVSLTLNGTLGGAGVLSKIGQLPLTLNGNGSALTGGVNINVGVLVVNNALGCGVTNQSTGTLMGGGTINGTVDTIGAVMPGASNVVGTLTVGPLILEGGSTLYFDLGYDTTSGSGSNDLIVVNGDLTVNGNTININPLSLLHRGIPYTLFAYTGNLIWNANLLVTDTVGYTYTVDTNTAGQVKIVASGGPPIWNGGSSTTSNWSDPANWGGVAINAGNLLWFSGLNRLNNNNDTAAGNSYGGLDFYTDAGAFVLNGNPITLSGSIVNDSANVQTIDLGMSYSANPTINGGAASVIIGGGVTNTAALGTLTLSGNGILTNLLACADPNSMTNILATTSNANWTLLDTPSPTINTIPLQLDVQAGTFNFGQGTSAPNLNSVANNNNSRLGVIAGAPATFNMVNGTLTIAARLNTGAGANTLATLNQSGGTLNLLSLLQCSDSSTAAYTAVNVSGGGLTVGTPAAGNTFFLASRGTGVLSVASSGLIQCGTLDVSRNAGGNTLGSVGVVNLNGGTLAVTRVGTATGSAQAGGTPTATFNFNGGTLKARASSGTFYQGSTAAPVCPITSIVKSGGAVIDSDTNAISILEPLQHDASLGSTLDGGLRKQGSGTLTLTAANTYTGPTLVNNGTLAVNGSLIAGAAVSVASGGTLGGTGTCGGNVTNTSGGTIAPGNSIGTLTVWSNVFLQAGSTILMEINRSSAPSNDVLRCTSGGTINLGGALIVTNIGPTLKSGDGFTLFSGALSGSIIAVLPPLWPGLSWNTGSLNSLGRISVTGTIIPPSITQVSMAGGSITLGGSGGLAGAPYYVVASTNVALPLSSWIPVATNTFDSSGNINISIPINPGVPDDFYRVQVP
jgi:fibronectin-binding autotransporter adhesin